MYKFSLLSLYIGILLTRRRTWLYRCVMCAHRFILKCICITYIYTLYVCDNVCFFVEIGGLYQWTSICVAWSREALLQSWIHGGLLFLLSGLNLYLDFTFLEWTCSFYELKLILAIARASSHQVLRFSFWLNGHRAYLIKWNSCLLYGILKTS